MRSYLVPLAAVAALLVSTSAQAADPAVKCETGKLKASGKYASCVLGADAKALLKGTSPDYVKCGEKIDKSWLKAETKGAGQCPNGEGDQSEVQSFLDACSQSASAALDGTTPLPADPITCDSDLTTCSADLATCDGDLLTCDDGLATCDSDLAALESEMRCPLVNALSGPWTTVIGGFDLCPSAFSQLGATVSTDLACPFYGFISMVGSISGNTLTLSENPSPACGGAELQAALTIDNSCDSAEGTYECVGLGLSGPVTTTRN